MPLSAAQMAAMSRLLDDALPLDAAKRERWLAELPAEHAALGSVLREALLPNAEPAMKRLDTLPRIESAGAADATPSGVHPGDRVGPYELVRRLGTGGMAEVWLARRVDGTLKRDVALKLPTLWRVRADLARRFARERDILAELEHTHIARLYDAGVSAEGMPYLALEYVQGKPLTAWCDEHQLGLRERLKLFLQVLDAVQYAHSHKVIHRDLKPSNILVTPAGQVRLLDFGVAKLLAGDAETEPTQITQIYGRALTPEYASPELLRGDPVDVRSDIYSLGVLLFELLTGNRPHRVKPGATLAQLEHAVTTADIDRPSDRVGPEAGGLRATTSGRLARCLRGDLDAITLKALARDPSARYESASALADDLQRHLTGEPVDARPDRFVYRLSRFVLRHRVGALASAAAVAIGLVASFLVFRGTEGRSASDQAHVAAATIANEKSIAVLPFVDMSERRDQEYFSDGLSEELINYLARTADLKVVARTSSFYFKGRQAPISDIAKALGVSHLLEGSVRKQGSELRITAQLIRATDGRHLWSASFDRKLDDIFKIQHEIASAIVAELKVSLREGAAPQARATSSMEAYSFYLRGKSISRHASSKEERATAVESLRRAIGFDPAYADAWAGLASALINQAEQGDGPRQQILGDARRAAEHALALNPGSPDAHTAVARVVIVLDWDWDAGLSQVRQALALDPGNAWALAWEGVLAAFRGDLAKAVPLIERSVANDPANPVRYVDLATVYAGAGRYADAAEAWQKMLDLNPRAPYAHTGKALALLGAGQLGDALAENERESLEQARWWGRTVIYRALGREGESEATLADYEKKYALIDALGIARAHAERGRVDTAFEWLERAYVQREGECAFVKTDPYLKNLRTDPRFKEFLRRMKLPE